MYLRNSIGYVAAVFIAVLVVSVTVDHAFATSSPIPIPQKQPAVRLLQPPDDGANTHTVVTGSIAQTFINYFNRAVSNILSISVGIATLWVLVAGATIVIFGGDQGKRSMAIGWIIGTILGLLLFMFLGLILRVLNSSFFTGDLLNQAMNMFVPTAYAGPVEDVCALVGGGASCSATNDAVGIAPVLAGILVSAVSGFAVLCIVWGGLLMILGQDEGMRSKGKNSVVFALGGLIAAYFAQTVMMYIASIFSAGSVSPTTGGADPVLGANGFVALATQAALGLFNAVFFVVAIVAGFRMAFSRGSADEFNKAKTALLWAIGGAIVANIGHAAVQLVISISGI